MRISTCIIPYISVNLFRMTTKNYVLAFVMGIALFLSCNKGNFDPTVCGDCPKLTTCIQGYCDCDTSVSFKFENECIKKDSAVFICRNPDTSFWPQAIILKYWGYDDFDKEHYYSIDQAAGYGNSFGGGSNEDYSGKYYFMGDFDTIYLRDWTSFYPLNSVYYNRFLAGRKYANDSFELRAYNMNLSTNQLEDTSAIMTFRRQ